MTKFLKISLGLMIFILWAHANLCAETIEILSPVYTIDRIYPSMKGPNFQKVNMKIFDNGKPELLWITGFKAEVVAADGKTSMSREFMCHNTFSISDPVEKHRKRLNTRNYGGTKRLFTLAQGQMEIKFPKGFGIPVYSDEPFMQQSQMLNLNVKDKVLEMRQKTTVEFGHDKDLKTPMKPLYLRDLYNRVKLPNKRRNSDGEDHSLCITAEAADGDRILGKIKGQKMTGHWYVKPGRHVNHSPVDADLNLPFDTTIHYIAVHLHPYAESLELYDLTAKKSLFKATTKNAPGKLNIESLTYYSSETGIPVYKNHKYELISVYNNTSSEETTAMAFMFVYLLDKEFDKKKSLAAQTPLTARTLF